MRILPVRQLLEAGEHPQRGRLAATGRADEDEELAVGDLHREVVHRRGSVEALRHVLVGHAGHRVLHLLHCSGRQREARRRQERVGDREREERHHRRDETGRVHDDQREPEGQRLKWAAEQRVQRVREDVADGHVELVDRKGPEDELEDAEREEQVRGDSREHERAVSRVEVDREHVLRSAPAASTAPSASPRRQCRRTPTSASARRSSSVVAATTAQCMSAAASGPAATSSSHTAGTQRPAMATGTTNAESAALRRKKRHDCR